MLCNWPRPSVVSATAAMRALPSGIQTARPMPLPPPLNNVRTRPSATLMAFNCQLASLPTPSVGCDESVAVRGPGCAEYESRIGGERGHQFLSAAIRLRDPDFNHTAVGNAALEDQLLAVGREVDGGIDVANQLSRRTSEHGHLVEIAEVLGALVRADEINVVAVGRETDSRDLDDIGGEHLHVALGGNVAHPQALLLSVPHGVDDVAAVGRDRHLVGFAIFRQLGDLHVLQIEAARTIEQVCSRRIRRPRGRPCGNPGD